MLTSWQKEYPWFLRERCFSQLLKTKTDVSGEKDISRSELVRGNSFLSFVMNFLIIFKYGIQNILLKFSPNPTGPRCLQETLMRREKYFLVKLQDWDSGLHSSLGLPRICYITLENFFLPHLQVPAAKHGKQNRSVLHYIRYNITTYSSLATIRITDIWSRLHDSLKTLTSALVLIFLNNSAVVTTSSWSILFDVKCQAKAHGKYAENMPSAWKYPEVPPTAAASASATWDMKLWEIDDNWKEHTQYLKNKCLEAGCREAVPWACISVSVCLSSYLSIYLIKLELGNRHADKVVSIYPWCQALGSSQVEMAKDWAGTKWPRSKNTLSNIWQAMT